MAPVFNSPQVFPISCRGVRLVSHPLSSFRSRCSYSSFPSPSLSALTFSRSFFVSISFSVFPSLAVYPSIRVALGLSSRLPLPRVHSCLLVARTSLPPVNGSHPRSPRDWRFAPLRCLKFSLLDVASRRYSPSPVLSCLCVLQSPAPFSKDFFHETRL